MERAHRDFAAAFEICPDFRIADWYAITSQWLGDDEASARCGERLARLAAERLGGNLWDGVHTARAYTRYPDNADMEPLQSAVDLAIHWMGDSQAIGTANRLIQYRQGEEVIIPAFVHNGNPEEQAESMIFNAITEFRFGDRAAAYEKLDQARDFVSKVFASPDGPRYTYIESDHGWCVSKLMLREASSLIELGSDEFDSQTIEAIARLRRDLQAQWGVTNAGEILHAVGKALVDHYDSQNSAASVE
jgi:hypothetical protein